jgi:hypothetical protein
MLLKTTTRFFQLMCVVVDDSYLCHIPQPNSVPPNYYSKVCQQSLTVVEMHNYIHTQG